MTRSLATFGLIVLGMLLLIGLEAACGEEIGNVFSNVMAPGGATPSP